MSGIGRSGIGNSGIPGNSGRLGGSKSGKEGFHGDSGSGSGSGPSSGFGFAVFSAGGGPVGAGSVGAAVADG